MKPDALTVTGQHKVYLVSTAPDVPAKTPAASNNLPALGAEASQKMHKT